MRIRTFASSLPRAFALVAVAVLLCCNDSNEPSDDPVIHVMNPRGVPAGSGGALISVYGEDLDPGSVVYWNGEERLSSMYSPNVVQAQLSAQDVATAGTGRVTVAAPDGRMSNALTFTVGHSYLEPQMTLASVAPPEGTAGAGALEITGTGSGFTPGTALVVDFSFLETTRVSSTTLRAVIPEALLAVNRPLDIRLGVPNVWIAGAGLTWNVAAAVPVISSLAPAGAGSGSDDLEVTVHGSGFTTGTGVWVNGVLRTTTIVSGTELLFTLTAADLSSAGNLIITVQTPAPGGGTSAPVNFTVTDLAPELAALPLAGVTAGRPGFTLIVHGQNLTSGTVVRWNGNDRVTTFRSGRRLMATIPASDVAAPGQAAITVRTPDFPSLHHRR